ncbi:hypothetical protein BDW74DRAFT_173964 [Aspergillus multicolor]|uniref:uncharacterized protein n=1 Tax=Aspergillus multicolor TaxID=41759 RepID=UPI003CCDA546
MPTPTPLTRALTSALASLYPLLSRPHNQVLLQIYTWTVHNQSHKPPHHWTIVLIPLTSLENPNTPWKLYHIFTTQCNGYELLEETTALYDASFLGPELYSRHEVCLLEMGNVVKFDIVLKMLLKNGRIRWVELLAEYLVLERWISEKQARALKRGVRRGRWEPGYRERRERRRAREAGVQVVSE